MLRICVGGDSHLQPLQIVAQYPPNWPSCSHICSPKVNWLWQPSWVGLTSKGERFPSSLFSRSFIKIKWLMRYFANTQTQTQAKMLSLPFSSGWLLFCLFALLIVFKSYPKKSHVALTSNCFKLTDSSDGGSQICLWLYSTNIPPIRRHAKKNKTLPAQTRYCIIYL